MQHASQTTLFCLSLHSRAGRRPRGPWSLKLLVPQVTPHPPQLSAAQSGPDPWAAGDRSPLRGCAVETGGGPGGRPGTRCVTALQRKEPCAASSGAALACLSLRCRMGPLPRTLELFYDVLSPYSWLSFEVTPGLGGQGRRAEQTQDTGPTVSCNSGRCPQGLYDIQIDREPGLKVAGPR